MKGDDTEFGNGGAAVGQDAERSNQVFAGYPSMDQFTKEGFKILMDAIKHSNALPTGRDWGFYNTSESFVHQMNDEGDAILQLMNSILRTNDIEANIKNRDVEEKTELVVEANDIILEKVAINVDEMNGIRKTVPQPVIIQTVSTQLPINGSWNRGNNTTFLINRPPSQFPDQDSNSIKLITAKNIVRPQKFFKDKPENTSKFPWHPRITDKPNSIKPLAIFLEEYEDRQEFTHPYELELERFVPTPEQLRLEEPELPKPLVETPLIEIDSPEQLDALVETLRNCKEFAVDLEHHSYRSFMGITCLMQISTKENDYIIDTLSLRDKLCVLNEVFTKPTIVKIFHGADRDVEWLQRDLSLYVVNMFDTHQAAKALQYSGLSLAYLMKRFCNIIPNKQFQLADWRIRPLPDEFKTYAREDTHYLIYIYQMMKKELLAKGNQSDNILKAVIERSTEICQKRYFKPILTNDSHMDLYRRCKKLFDNQQLYALKELFGWRDHIAREEDESLGYVLPNHMLLQISETLPREMQGILACCSPIPPLVRSHLLELHQIILKAREQPLVKPILKEDNRGGTTKQLLKVTVDSPLHCPHDLNKITDLPESLSTLLNNQSSVSDDIKNLINRRVEIQNSVSSCSTFNQGDGFDDEVNRKKIIKEEKGLTFLSPYERYLLVRPFVQAEEDQAAAKAEEEKKQEELKLQDNRTDEDRIASVREHFLKISKQFGEEMEAKKKAEEEEEMSLVQMGGSKKRKREPSPENYNPETSYEAEEELSNARFCTPAPSGNRSPYTQSRSQKSKKRSNNWQSEGKGQVGFNNKDNWNNQQGRSAGQQKGIRKNIKPQNNQKPQRFQQQSQVQHLQRAKRRRGRSGEIHSVPEPNFNQNVSSNQANKRPKKTKQTDTNFVAYDYSSVDFRQFHGGAGSVNASGPLSSHYKTKGPKRTGRRGAKSSTFSNTSRGRGR